MSSQQGDDVAPTPDEQKSAPVAVRAKLHSLSFDEQIKTPRRPRTARTRPASPHPDFVNYTINRFPPKRDMRAAKNIGSQQQNEHTFLSKLSVTLTLWNFLVAVPIAYALAVGIKFVMEKSGFCLYNDILLLRSLFIVFNMLFILSWAVQLDKQAQKAKCDKELAVWDARIAQLEQALADIQARQIEEQFFPDASSIDDEIEKPRGRALQRVQRES
ncbi:hypothetical protein PVAG01_05013 [Phlyctema vagabunda]|uniref:Uncharacterized protein n=1 Tax=Phlyctema vagabunda TaxID=108571 RepID=A0ABR4PIX2_9HELO